MYRQFCMHDDSLFTRWKLHFCRGIVPRFLFYTFLSCFIATSLSRAVSLVPRLSLHYQVLHLLQQLSFSLEKHSPQPLSSTVASFLP